MKCGRQGGMKVKKCVSALLLLLVLSCGGVTVRALSADDETVAGTVLRFAEQDPSSSLDEWAVIGLCRGGAYDATAYLSAIALQLERGEGRVEGADLIDYARIALAVTAAGGRADDLAGYSLLAPLSDPDVLFSKSINCVLFSLLAMDAGEYSLPSGLRESIVSHLLSLEIEGGGWSLYRTFADVDVTAVAVTALAPYRGIPEVAAAIGRARMFLEESQEADGGFVSMGARNAESSAQVILALTSLGEMPDEEILSAFLSYRTEDGFSHLYGGGTNAIATAEGYLALVACRRLSEGLSPVYQMCDAAPRSVHFTVLDAETAREIPILASVAHLEKTERLLGKLLLSDNRAEYAETEQHLRDALTAQETAKETLSELDRALMSLPRAKEITRRDRERIASLRASVDGLPEADRATLRYLTYLEEAESALGVLDRERVTETVLAAVGAALLMLLLLGAYRKRAARRARLRKEEEEEE